MNVFEAINKGIRCTFVGHCYPDVVSAPDGSIYLHLRDGGPDNDTYVKMNGSWKLLLPERISLVGSEDGT